MEQPLEQQFLTAYDEHADAIFRFCYAHTGKRELATDLTQDTFTRTWRYLANGKQVREMRPFLYRTARNAITDHLRSQRTQSLDAMREAGFDIADDASPAIATLAEAGRAVKLMQELDPKHRDILVMRYVAELQPREIATTLGESENVVSVRIHRAMAKLKELMGTT